MKTAEGKIEKSIYLVYNKIDHDNTKNLRLLKSPLVFRRGYTRGF